MAEGQLNEFIVFFEELRQVAVFFAFIGLSVEVDGADAVLNIFYIGDHVHDEVIGAHITQKLHEATFIELDKFFRETDHVGARVVEVVTNEDIAWYTGDMFFDKGGTMGQVGHSVGGEQVFHFQSVNAVGIGLFDVEVVVVVIVFIHDADAEGLAVTEIAEVDAGHIEVTGEAHITFCFQDGVHADECLSQVVPFVEVVGDGIPVAVFSVSVFDGGGIGKSEQVLIGEGQLNFSAVVDQVLPQGGLGGIDRFFP